MARSRRVQSLAVVILFLLSTAISFFHPRKGIKAGNLGRSLPDASSASDKCMLSGIQTRGEQNKIFYGLLFNHELDILEILLNEIYKEVDRGNKISFWEGCNLLFPSGRCHYLG